MNRIFLLMGMICFLSMGSYAQKTEIFKDPDALYKSGLELFKKKKYGSAQRMFQNAIEEYGHKRNDFRTNAEFYSALCAIELYNDDAEFQISTFIANHPESQMVNEAYYEMGKFQYRQKNYEQAVSWLEKVSRKHLPKEDRPEFSFKLGYSYFSMNELHKASLQFYEIKDVNTDYTAPALYYYSHINYTNGNYQSALKGFQKLEDSPVFAAIVPYYITQIYYLQKKYDKVLTYAPALLENANTKRLPEIARVIGEAYMAKGKYEKALPYLEQYKEKAGVVSRKDNYQLALAYYKTSNLEKATENFELVTGESDSLSQSAYFYLADTYLKADDKNKARLSFSAASKMSFFPKLQEEALFNYAKITFELYYSPFNDAIDAFQEFLEAYPKSKHSDKVREYLVLAFLNAKNYKAALESLEKIQDKDRTIEKAYQKVAYFRGLELFNNLDFKGAIKAFNKSLKYDSYNRTLKASAHYWKAEAYYRLQKYPEAIDNYDAFIYSNGAFDLDEYAVAHYNLGYSYFKQKDYANCKSWFRKYLSLTKQDDKARLADSYNRVGDANFKERHYWAAIEFYDKSVELNITDPDYAQYQRAYSLGKLNRPEKKIESLNDLLSKFPNSDYSDDALFELGRSHIKLNQPQKAIRAYKRIVTDYPGSSYERKAMLQLGLVYYNEDQLNDALAVYKDLVKKYPNSSEANSALLGVKNIMVEKNDVDAYFTYVKEIGKYESVSQSEMDSLSYIAAEKVYLTEDYVKASEAMANYIKKYPNGTSLLNAHFYKADSDIRSENYEEALSSLAYLTSGNRNFYTEQALLAAASLLQDMKRWEESRMYYLRLEKEAETKSNLLTARKGVLRNSIELKDHQSIIDAAEKVLISEKVSQELIREANFAKAQSLYAIDKKDLARDAYRQVTVNVQTAEGAESIFMIAKILFEEKKYEGCEKEIFDFSSMNTSQEYWLARAFILLADVYEAKEDAFQAKATLQSVIDNYENTDDEIIDTANAKLMAIIKKEKEAEKQKQIEEIEINLEKLKAAPVKDSFPKQEVDTNSVKLDSLQAN